MELRPYQESMVDAVWAAMPQDQFILIQAATGAGKTIFFSELIKRLLLQWPKIRIAILAHRGILVEQARDKLLQVWPESKGMIGLASSSIKGVNTTDETITIGTIQTIARKLETTAPYDLVIIDECHRMSPKNKKSQYNEFINTMIQYNPKIRFLGVTATAYRLGHGYIYGQLCREDNVNWFPHLHYRVGIKELIKQGYLCEYRAKQAENIEEDLKTIKVSGDYNINELEGVMVKKEHIGTAVKAVKQYAADRKRIIVFCVTIEHAERLKKAFEKANYNVGIMHSKQHKFVRESYLKMFETGEVQIILNVMVLSEGFDSPAIDCVVLCRPTKAPSLFVQMVGRGLRPHKDKKDVLILDLANNCITHGDPDNPNVIIPNGKKRKGEPVIKACPKCLEINTATAKICVVCDYEWPQAVTVNNGNVTMTDVKWGLQEKLEPFVVRVDKYSVTEYESKKGNLMLKLSLSVKTPGIFYLRTVNEFLIFDGPGSRFGRKKWFDICGTDPPETLEEAVDRIGEIEMSIPDEIEVVEDGKFLKVFKWAVDSSHQKMFCKKCNKEQPYKKLKGAGPHAHKAICSVCNSWIKWLPKKKVEETQEEIPF